VPDSRRLPYEPQLCELIFAARDLSKHQIKQRRTGDQCSECETRQSTRAFLEHKPGCKAGRVLRALDKICKESPSLPHHERRTASSELTLEPCAAGEDRPHMRLPALSQSLAHVGGEQ
jgi:hypothetical protein